MGMHVSGHEWPNKGGRLQMDLNMNDASGWAADSERGSGYERARARAELRRRSLRMTVWECLPEKE
eukprot:4650287-Pyramimonas_sp.AAC.1